MAKSNSDIIGPALNVGAVAILYFGLIKPVFNLVGITKSSADAATENENHQAATKANGWDPNFYKNYYGTKHLLTDASVTMLAKRIYNAWGIFNDDENEIFGAFRQLQNLLQLSQLADKYVQLYGDDLLSRLANPWYKSNDGLDPDEFNVIAKIVNALPVN